MPLDFVSRSQAKILTQSQLQRPLVCSASYSEAENAAVKMGMGRCMLCNCGGYKGSSGQSCDRCGHSPADHSR
jgi:hypothetical protein